MTMNDRLAQFVIAAAKRAVEMPDSQVTFAECAAEYTSQILEDDYNSVVLFAKEVGIEIPPELIDAIEED